MPRLLILCEYPTVLGGERSMLATLPAVAADGFDICIAAPSTARFPLFSTTFAYRVSRGIRAMQPIIARLWLNYAPTWLRSYSEPPDLIHANSLSTARIAGPVAAELGVKSIGHLRDIIKLSANAIADLNRHDKLIAVSNATRDFHIRQGLDPQKCCVLYNGVDLCEFRPRLPTGYLHRELELPKNARLIAVIGQLGLRKGTDLALMAGRESVQQFPDLHWLIVGERTSTKDESRVFETTLQQLAASPPFTGHVHFLGNRTDIAELLAECALLVHAAHQEPLGRVLLEAAASGLAIVATNVGGTPEIFTSESGAAVLVPPNDSEAISNAISLLLANESRRLSCGAAARRRAEAAFDIRDASRNLITQYRMCLA